MTVATNRRTKIRKIASLLSSVVVGSAVGAAVQQGWSTSHGLPIAEPTVETFKHDHGGFNGPFEVEVKPEQIARNAQGKSELRLSAVVKSRFEKRAGFQVSSYVVDASGNVVSALKREPAAVGLAKQSLRFSVNAPGGLKDGIYQVRTMTVGSDGSEESVLQNESYFRVEDGEPSPASANEWFAQSDVMHAQEG